MSFYRNPEDVGIMSRGGPNPTGPLNGQPPFLEPARGQAQGILRPGLEGIHRYDKMFSVKTGCS